MTPILTAPSGPAELSPRDLASVRNAVTLWLESLQVVGEPYGCLRGGPQGPPRFLRQCGRCPHSYDYGGRSEGDAFGLPKVGVDRLPHRLAEPGRRKLSDLHPPFQAACQRHRHWGPGASGGRMDYPVELYRPLAMPESVGKWLETIDWSAQWTASHL